MFSRCTSLKRAPVILTTTINGNGNSLQTMFYGCASLNYIKAMFLDEPTSNNFSSWVSGVSSTGTFVKNAAATWNVTGINGIPTNWTVETATA
jgi:hypothetical protein